MTDKPEEPKNAGLEAEPTAPAVSDPTGPKTAPEPHPEPDPPEPEAELTRFQRFAGFVKEIDGFLLLFGLIVTASLSFLVDRRNQIDRHASASIAVIDNALQTVLTINQLESTTPDPNFEERLTTLRFLHYFGEYQVEPARVCLDLLIADVDRFSKGALPERSLGDGAPRLEPHEAIFADARQLKNRIGIWRAKERAFYAVVLPSHAYVFDSCFAPPE